MSIAALMIAGGPMYALMARPLKEFDDMSHKDINKNRKSKGDKARSRKEHRERYRV